MPREGFEPTIPAFERVKTVHALDRAATVIGHLSGTGLIITGYENISFRPTTVLFPKICEQFNFTELLCEHITDTYAPSQFY
jgi:hypothetical protein